MKASYRKNATRDIFLSSNVVRDEANMDRRTAGVTGMPPFSPSGTEGSEIDLESDDLGNGCFGVAPDDTEDVLCLDRPGVTVDELDDI